MVRFEKTSPARKSVRPSAVYRHSYAVLAILILLTIGATLAYDQTSSGSTAGGYAVWTPFVLLIGLCVSLLIFGITYREASALLVLHEKTGELLAAQKENEVLLTTEQASRIAAEEANIAKNHFLALVSHELRTPLHAIAGWNRLLKTRGLSEETRRTAVEKIEKNVRIQVAIVEELLSFSKIISNSSTVKITPVRMRDVFEDAVSTISVGAVQKGITLVSDDALDSQIVRGDVPRLRMAILNVLENAVKFTQPGGHIQAGAFEAEGCVKCVVKDDGVGIPPESIPRIFEMYRQADPASTRRYGGLGLGLTIAERIVVLHDGTIEAKSEGIGKGSTFTISIPLSSSLNAAHRIPTYL